MATNTANQLVESHINPNLENSPQTTLPQASPLQASPSQLNIPEPVQRDITPRLLDLARRWSAIAVIGPHQSGKTTLCRQLFANLPYVSLENFDVREFASDDSRGFLAQFTNGAVIDEIQHVPELFSHLQGIIDSEPTPGKWILIGSHNFSLMTSIQQTLAGRMAICNLLPFSHREINRFDQHPETLDEVLLTGSYPSILNGGHNPSEWLSAYVTTYIERDVRLIENIKDLDSFQKLLSLCAGGVGRLLNYASLAGDIGRSQPTIKNWIGIMEASFILFRLRPFHANLSKRLVRTPMLYLYDSGLACWLLGIQTAEQLRSHPLRSYIFETWCVSEVFKHKFNQTGCLNRRTNLQTGHSAIGHLSFYRDSNGAEADLLIEQPSGITLMDVKSSATPSATLLRGVKRVQGHLAELDRNCENCVIYGGSEFQNRKEGKFVPWNQLGEFLNEL